ncbi:MAG TPA: hypothetical protein V6D17_02490 [Candidatus Obscuribacterales bacterium]
MRSPRQQISHFLKTGHSDVLPQGWPGENWLVQAQTADKAMRQALIEEVQRRSQGLPTPEVPITNHDAFTRSKVSPMVSGLFAENERRKVLEMLEKSVVFLTADNILEVLQRCSLSTSWTIANLYLGSIGGELLGKKASLIVGFSEETTCYVSHEYFRQTNRFADFVVHEAAHVFHNCKRFTVGLPETRTKEFLLNIEFCQRETFAYACEVYSRILQLAETRRERLQLLKQALDEFIPPDHKVDLSKFHAALGDACEARNGWNKILQVCAPPKRVKPRLEAVLANRTGG